MLAWVVIDRQHRPRASRGPRQSRKSGPVHALPLPTLLFNIQPSNRSFARGCRTEIPIWSGPSTVFPSYPLSFQTIAHSFALTQNSTLLFSSASALFAKNHPGWGVLTANQLTPGFNVSTFKSKIPIGSGRSDVQTFQRVLATPFFPLPKASGFSATWDFAPIVWRSRTLHHKSARWGEVRLARLAARLDLVMDGWEPNQIDPDRVGVVSENFMGTLNRAQLESLERRGLQLTILASAFVLVQAAGLAMFMYPLVFLRPVGNKWTLRVAFFGFCALTPLFVGYLLDRQRTVRKLKEQILEELDRHLTLQHQASVDLLHTMPDLNHFWDRLTMEYRRAMTMQKTLSLLLVKAKSANASAKVDRITGANENDETSEAWSDAAKAMSRKLRPTDSVYRLSTDTFALVLPETDVLNAKRIAVRLQEELQGVRAKYNLAFDITAHNYPEHVKSSHELEDIVKSLLPAQDEWAAPAPAEKLPVEKVPAGKV
jgi:GGDEF domain-containing protein